MSSGIVRNYANLTGLPTVFLPHPVLYLFIVEALDYHCKSSSCKSPPCEVTQLTQNNVACWCKYRYCWNAGLHYLGDGMYFITPLRISSHGHIDSGVTKERRRKELSRISLPEAQISYVICLRSEWAITRCVSHPSYCSLARDLTPNQPLPQEIPLYSENTSSELRTKNLADGTYVLWGSDV